MEKYSVDINIREDGPCRIRFQKEWESLRTRIGYAIVSAKVTPGIELVSREAFERLEALMAELPENARKVGQLFLKGEFAWDEEEAYLLIPLSLLEYAGITTQAVLLVGEDIVALCSPETAAKY